MSVRDEVSDRELVDATLSGDKEAYGVLVERYQDAVYNLAYRMSNNHQEAGDATQEAFVKGYQKLRKYDTKHSFRNWIMSICANNLKNRFRAAARKRGNEDAYLMEWEHSEKPDPRVAEVEDVLQQMPDEMKMPLVLKYTEGLKHSDIAKILNISTSASKMRTKRALQELKAKLADAGGEL